jgi:uncharacterized membrane protein YkvA (DUF1232 family)
MAEKMKNTNVPPQRGIGFFRQLIEQVRLSWALLLDNRVPLVLKLIPLAAIAYIVSPIDLIPDIFLGLGQLDDLGILMAALTTFNSLAPGYVVEEHLARIRAGNVYSIQRDKEGTVIDVKPKRTQD